MKVTYRKTPLLFSLWMMVFILCITACRPNASQTSSIIINPCSPPCWQNIVPGKTTKDEVIKLLNTLPDINKGSIETITTIEPNDSIKWSWNPKAADYSGRIFIQDDVTFLITVAPKENRLHFEEVILKLGEPEQVLAFLEKGERVSITIFILYPTKGYGFLDYYTSSFDNTKSTIEIKPEMEVKYIWFGEVENFYLNLTNGYIGRLTSSFVKEGVQPWNGYGQYNLIER